MSPLPGQRRALRRRSAPCPGKGSERRYAGDPAGCRTVTPQAFIAPGTRWHRAKIDGRKKRRKRRPPRIDTRVRDRFTTERWLRAP